jgi:hypothetical protein
MAISPFDRAFSPIAICHNESLIGLPNEIADNLSPALANMDPVCVVEYYYDGNSADVSTGTLKLINGRYEFENGAVIIPASVSSLLSYRIGMRYNNENDRTKWYGMGQGWQDAVVFPSFSGPIEPSGGMIELSHGDQHYGNTSVSAAPGALDDTTQVTITEIATTFSIGQNVFMPTQDIRKLYKIEIDKSYNKNFTFKFFAGDIKDYEVFYRASENCLWSKLEAG